MNKKITLAKRILAVFLVLAMTLGLSPWQAIKVRAGNIVVKSAVLYGEYDRYDLKKVLVQVSISGDSGTYSVGYKDTTNFKYTLGNIVIPGTTGGTAEGTFEIIGTGLKNAANIISIDVGGIIVAADYSYLPNIKSSSANLVDDGSDIELGGQNFLTVSSGNVEMKLEGANLSSTDFAPTGDMLTLRSVTRTGDGISQNVVFKQYKEETDAFGNITQITVSKRYSSVFRIVEKLNMDLKITPDRGEAGSFVYVSFNNSTDTFDNHSVFFLKDETDVYNSANMVKASDISYSQDRKVMKIKVPNLQSRSYIIVLTNLISATSGDMSSYITKRQNVGNFFITGVGISPIITYVHPPSGPNNGDFVEILGKNFEELNYVEGFSQSTAVPDPANISVITGPINTNLIPGISSGTSSTNVQKLKIDYGTIQDDAGNPKKVVKYITVFIGSDTEIQTTGYVLSNTGDRTDIIQVKTRPTSNENKIVDVFMTIETEIEDISSGTKTTSNYIAMKENAYTFVPSYTYPVIDELVPEKVQIQSTGSGYETKEDMVLGIHGRDFKVYRYRDAAGVEIINYPIIGIGGNLNNNSGDIVLKRIANKVYTKDALGDFTVEVAGASIEILDDNGKVLDGTSNSDTGTNIIITLPKGRKVTEPGKKPVAIKNPVLNSPYNGNDASVKDYAVEFVLVQSNNPIIESVSPIVTTVDSGEEITVKGSNFDKDVRVIIAGMEVPKASIKREVGTDGRSVILKFNAIKAPDVKEGPTKLMIMNPDGGIAVSDFTYVKTANQDPKITGFSPDKGTKNTAVLVDGNNFLKPNPAVTSVEGLGIYQLIGSRILMDGVDINEYNTNSSGTPVLEPYTALSPNDFLLRYDTTSGELVAADYYHSIMLRTVDNNYFVVDVENNGQIVITNGGSTSAGSSQNSRYELDADSSGNIRAVRNSKIYSVSVSGGTIQLTNTSDPTDSLSLTLMTTYKIDTNGKIIGNRVKVVDRGRIVFTVPELQLKMPPAGYTITVQNPDTRKATSNSLFYYLNPQSTPEITLVRPSSGSIDGGYTVVIEGNNFENTSRVYVNGVLVPVADTLVDSLGKSIIIKVPKYTGNLSSENLDRKTVPVTVVNEDGGTAYKENGFTYIIPFSQPKIFADKFTPKEGSAAGGEIVEIWGYDFRFFEPRDSRQRSRTWVQGTTSTGEIYYYNDIDNEDPLSQMWNSFSKSLDIPETQPLTPFRGVIDPPLWGYSTYIKTPIIPKVYFGTNEAKVLDFYEGYLKVLTPPGKAGVTDVYVVNNDAGMSNKVKFTYKSSNPKIDQIVPDVGNKLGKENIEIIGSGFANSSIKVYKPDSTKETKNMPLVRFGKISNKDLDRNHKDSGVVNAGRAEINLPGDLKVTYTADPLTNEKKIVVSAKSGDVTYTKEYDYDDSTVFVPMDQLYNGTSQYPGYEMLKLEFDQGRLLVERGYTPEVNLVSSGQLELRTPSYYTVGDIDVSVINEDGGIANGKFKYKNPDSKPSIINILKEDRSPIDVIDSGVSKKVQKVNYKGGSTITIVGSDFRDNAEIKIGDVATIQKGGITYGLPNRLTFTMPAVAESCVGKRYKVFVVNEDGGTASSESAIPPIYIEFIKGETQPAIEKATPDRGPASGGTRVKLEGKDFRGLMEGFEGRKLTVYFGGIQVPDSNVSVVDYKTIIVITPPHAPGEVDIKVENPDGELAILAKGYTYLSSPKIVSVVDPNDPNESSRIEILSVEGGQEIKVKGSGYMDGAKVVFSPVVKPVEDGTTTPGTEIFIEGKPYILEDGKEGTKVTFVNEETLKVVTPSGRLDTKGIIVVNPDGGASNVYGDIAYGIPTLEAPTGVRAELVYNRYIKIYWNGVDSANEYEVFVVVDDKETELIGITAITSYLYQDLKSDTSYKFIVKAVGDLGSSKPSRESNVVKTGAIAGTPDNDGSIKDNTTSGKNGDIAEVSIGIKDYKNKPIVIDLTTGTLAGSREVVVSIPAAVIVKNDSKDIKIIGKDYTASFNPGAFMVSRIKENQDRTDTGIRFRILPVNDSAGIENIGGFTTALSTQYMLKADVFVGSSSTPIDYLYKPLNIIFDYDVAKAQMKNLSDINLYRADESSGGWGWVASRSGQSSSISAQIERMGKYLVIGKRR